MRGMMKFSTPENNDEFQEEFRVQRIEVAAAARLANLPPTEIATFFRENPGVAKALLNESYDGFNVHRPLPRENKR